MGKKDEIDELKCILERAHKKSDEILARKQHLETKTLYLLQAVAVISVLLTLLDKYSDKSGVSFLKIVSTVCLVLAIITLMISLIDDLFIVEHEYKDTPYPDKELAYYKKHKDENMYDYYEAMIKAVSKSTRAGRDILITKYRFFKGALYLFVISIILLLFSSCGGRH